MKMRDTMKEAHASTPASARNDSMILNFEE